MNLKKDAAIENKKARFYTGRTMKTTQHSDFLMAIRQNMQDLPRAKIVFVKVDE